MQIKINADSEIIAYAVIGEVENGITVDCDEVTVIKGTDVKCIGLLCSKTESNSSYTFRDFGTRYEDSFNMLLIDKGNIKILRFGAGGDINV